jgi:hypothetical protein
LQVFRPGNSPCKNLSPRFNRHAMRSQLRNTGILVVHVAVYALQNNSIVGPVNRRHTAWLIQLFPNPVKK